jgi:hypothetical protein
LNAQTVNLAPSKSFGAHAAEGFPFAALKPRAKSALKPAVRRRMEPCRCLNFPIAAIEALAPCDSHVEKFMRYDTIASA